MRADIKTGTISGARRGSYLLQAARRGVLLPAKGNSPYVRRSCRSHRHRTRRCSHVAAPLTSTSRRADAAASGLATLSAWSASVVSR